MRLLSGAAVLLLLASPLRAQSEVSKGPIEERLSAGEVTATVAPQEVQEVIATGKAAFGKGGILGARKAAETQALRNAVEKALGVYVSARSLTQNYVLVRDQVLTRADGFATLKEVVSEEVGTEDVTVTVRALVTLKPLAKQLKALKLTRAYRVYVQVRNKDEKATAASRSAATELQNQLASAGFVVVDDMKNADLLVKVAPRFSTTHETPLDTAAGPMTMYAVEGETAVQAVRAGTGEIVAAFTASDTANHINLTTARAETARVSLNSVTPRLIDALMVLPAAQSQPVTLVVSRLRSATQVGKLEDALEQLTGVQKVTRRGFAGGTAQWEIEILSDTASLLSRELEESSLLRSFRLTVAAESRSRIVAVTGALRTVHNSAN